MLNVAVLRLLLYLLWLHSCEQVHDQLNDEGSRAAGHLISMHMAGYIDLLSDCLFTTVCSASIK